MELVMREWLLRRLYPDPRHKSEALVEGKPAPPFSRNTSSPKMTGKKNIPPPSSLFSRIESRLCIWLILSLKKWLSSRSWQWLGLDVRARICKPRKRGAARRAIRQPYLTFWPARLKRLAESIPWNQFLNSLKVYKFGLYTRVKETCASRFSVSWSKILRRHFFVVLVRIFLLRMA